MAGSLQCAALLYHHVGPQRPNTYPGLTVSATAFARQIDTLARRGYQGISANQWMDARAGATLPDKPVIITFDDGYADLSEYALPVLAENRFGATVFVVTDLLGKEDAWLRAEGKAPQRLMTAEQVRDWADRGFEMGAHSRSHADLTRVSRKEATAEVSGSRRRLEEIVSAKVRCFAYPYGFYNSSVLEIVRHEFEAAFTVEFGRNDRQSDPHRLRRTMVAPTDGPTAILWRAARGDYPIQRARAKLARIRDRIFCGS
jgi:peptidoglycan/xylan/chitin deacetylase (PgdA/CDA1 family)